MSGRISEVQDRVKEGEVKEATEELLNLKINTETQNQEKATIKAEYMTAQRKVSNLKNRQIMKAIYKESSKEEHSMAGTVGNRTALRERILMASLFPSIYSK